jgi:hypothetical protein
LALAACDRRAAWSSIGTIVSTKTRYRVQDGRTCIDIKVAHTRQLFDGRDPAPFRERDLDDDAVEYILAAAEEIPRAQRLAIDISISAESDPAVPAESIVSALRGHFGHELAQTHRRLREHLRRGQMGLVVGFAVLMALLGFAELTLRHWTGPMRDSLREGFVIMGWVAMWRPLETLLYDWWPIAAASRQLRRIIDAPVSVRYTREEATGSARSAGLTVVTR